MKKLSRLFVIAVCVIFTAGCAVAQPSEVVAPELTGHILTEGQPDTPFAAEELYKELPDISSFSGEHIMSFQYAFPSIISSTLVRKGTAEAVLPEDPELIRLLNYILYSENEGYSTIVQGLLSQEDIQWHYDSYDDYLILEFALNESEESAFVPNLQKAMIAPDCILLFGSQFGEDYVEEHFPYQGILVEWNISGKLSESDYLNLTNNPKMPWINLLQLSGLIEQESRG